MKKRILIVSILILCLSCGSYSIGLLLGGKIGGLGSMATLPDYIENDSSFDANSKVQFAWQIALDGEITFLPVLGLKFELGFTRFNVKIEGDQSGVDFELKYDYTMFNIFLGPQLNLGGFLLYGGIFIGFNVHSTYEGTGALSGSGKTDTRSTLIGVSAGLGYMISAGPIKIPITAEFKYGFNNLEGMVDGAKVYGVFVNVGVLFSL